MYLAVPLSNKWQEGTEIESGKLKPDINLCVLDADKEQNPENKNNIETFWRKANKHVLGKKNEQRDTRNG